MKADQLKENQARLKEQYKADPASAVQTLKAVGKIDTANLACDLIHPSHWTPAGLHEHSGGDGTFSCPVEIMLAGLVGCAGVTMAAVANAMKIELREATVTALGTMDFKGTLAVDREAPVGLTKIDLQFDLNSDADGEKLAKLVELTERYCVVDQTLRNPPELEVMWNKV